MPVVSRHWAAPPTRREVMLLLFSLTVFVLSYNLETSLGLVGVNPQKLSASYLSSIGIGSKDPGFDVDGRRPAQWRDDLENLIVGDWEWREGEVSGVPRGQAARSGSGRHAMIYNFGKSLKGKRTRGKRDGEEDHGGVSLSTGVTVKDQFVRWGRDVPQTRVLAHAPGYTVLENVVAVNGTLFVVADDWTKVPKLSDIASSSLDPSRPPRIQDWQMLTTSQARDWFGTYAAKIHGTSWIALDTADNQDPYLLLSLFRTHASLMSPQPSSAFTSSSGLRIIAPGASPSLPKDVPAPLRLIFPHLPTFSTPHIPPAPGEDEKKHPPPRERSYFGIHPLLPKAVLPTVGLWFEEDWEDLTEMHVPFLFERVVVADRGAADRGRANWLPPAPSSSSDAAAPAAEAQVEARAEGLGKRAVGDEGEPVWAAPFVGLSAPQGWWAPVHAALLRYLHLPNDSPSATSGAGGGFWGGAKEKRKPVVTYVSMQDEPRGAGARLAHEEHEKLVLGLRRLEREGVLGEVHVVRGNGSVSAPEWVERMGAFAKATIVMGPYGHQLADSVFMRSPVAEVQVPKAHQKQKEKAATPAALPPMLMEFFPPGTFVRDQQYAVQALKIDYLGWWAERTFTSDNLPELSYDSRTDPVVPIDVDAVLRTVREEAARRAA
ncbi:hypothetical protein BD309DRAFT_950501 [Dichomitus squalens]|uniref:Uncharacterized protein n=1 Tax=Dichomitus squalens TaxID=114155 RepID=A0A4Q9PXX7_9APHY|nr:hypothetical protein BD309DRAFT_950501 [Dichomitus squalens]TBU59386.1 hypothetical protein BD310DRAFT_925008 [Dichomitus squalens]